MFQITMFSWYLWLALNVTKRCVDRNSRTVRNHSYCTLIVVTLNNIETYQLRNRSCDHGKIIILIKKWKWSCIRCTSKNMFMFWRLNPLIGWLFYSNDHYHKNKVSCEHDPKSHLDTPSRVFPLTVKLYFWFFLSLALLQSSILRFVLYIRRLKPKK